MPISRFSSRTESLDRDFLAKTLSGASRYLRIAGYFRSSIFELVGEEIAKIPEVKIVCNSELDLVDFQVASRRDMEIKELWNGVDVAAEALLQKERYQRLDALLRAGNAGYTAHGNFFEMQTSARCQIGSTGGSPLLKWKTWFPWSVKAPKPLR